MQTCCVCLEQRVAVQDARRVAARFGPNCVHHLVLCGGCWVRLPVPKTCPLCRHPSNPPSEHLLESNPRISSCPPYDPPIAPGLLSRARSPVVSDLPRNVYPASLVNHGLGVVDVETLHNDAPFPGELTLSPSYSSIALLRNRLREARRDPPTDILRYVQDASETVRKRFVEILELPDEETRHARFGEFLRTIPLESSCPNTGPPLFRPLGVGVERLVEETLNGASSPDVQIARRTDRRSKSLALSPAPETTHFTPRQALHRKLRALRVARRKKRE